MEEPRTASGAGDAAGIPSPYRILLVDDQPMMHEALRRILSGADDLELHCCAEGARALSRAEEIRPAVILQDLIMPDMDGLMLVRLYRSHGSTRDVPVVVLSSRDEADTKAEAFGNGANDYLVKLPHRIELLARLRYHARAHAAMLERNAALEELQRISITDGLTKIYNRRYLDRTLASELQRAKREQLPLSLILMDVDHFKQFNDLYGHHAGDHCLAEVAGAMQSSLRRTSDTAARYGGEEFAAILPNTDSSGAFARAEGIRKAVMELNIKHEAPSTTGHVTVSLGVATVVPGMEAKAASLVQSADQSLYRAKEEGRNRTAVAAAVC